MRHNSRSGEHDLATGGKCEAKKKMALASRKISITQDIGVAARTVVEPLCWIHRRCRSLWYDVDDKVVTECRESHAGKLT